MMATERVGIYETWKVFPLAHDILSRVQLKHVQLQPGIEMKFQDLQRLTSLSVLLEEGLEARHDRLIISHWIRRVQPAFRIYKFTRYGSMASPGCNLKIFMSLSLVLCSHLLIKPSRRLSYFLLCIHLPPHGPPSLSKAQTLLAKAKPWSLYHTKCSQPLLIPKDKKTIGYIL
jgi:hypothetical protein